MMISNEQIDKIKQKLDDKGYITSKQFYAVLNQQEEVESVDEKRDITQREWVENQLIQNGIITRNQCLKVYISRLADIIQNLEKKGWRFETFFEEYEAWGKSRKDYVYKAVRGPNARN